MTRATSVGIVIGAVVALSGCGVTTRTVTVGARHATPPATSPPATSPPATSPSAAAPLPKGVLSADGTYTMRVVHSDYDKENIIVDESSPSISAWRFATTCHGSKCSVRMMRQLESGGYKTLTLRPVAGRPNVFAGTATSSDECLIEPKKVVTHQRYSVRLHSAVDRDGRQTARRIDAFLTETAPGCTKGTKGVLSWRGALKG